MSYAYELVDVSDEEQYFTLGIWTDEKEARNALADGAIPEDYPLTMNDTGYVKLELRRREIGWSESGFVVGVREWVEQHEADECTWKEIVR